MDINFSRCLDYNILKSGYKSYLADFKALEKYGSLTPDWTTNPDMGYLINSVGLLYDILFSVKNKDIEIKKNYKDLEETLLNK